MSPTDAPPQAVAPEQWLALLADPLDERERAQLREVLAAGGTARLLHREAAQIQRQARALRAAPVDDLTRARLWRAVAPAASEAARRAARRSALGVLGASPTVRAVAATLAVLMVAAGLWAAAEAIRRHPAAPDLGAPPAAVTSSAAVALGPGTATGPVRWPVPGSHRGAGNPLAPATSAPRPHPAHPSGTGTDGASAGNRTVALRPRPGERRLRCGGLIALRGATAQIEVDAPARARVRLTRGRVALRVPKLPRGGGVEVHTPDARVRVIGTRFTVEPHGDGTTTVAVTEGVVWVTPTGRGRRTRVLRAGELVTVMGEAAALRTLARQFREALAAGRLDEAIARGRRYLRITNHPLAAFGIQLRLAAALVRLKQPAAAVALYQGVADHAPSAVARQNALAFLARLEAQQGHRSLALVAWERLARLHPGGLYEREALMHLLLARCGRPESAALLDRLRRVAPRHPPAAALIRRCAFPGAAPAARPTPAGAAMAPREPPHER